MCAVQQQQQSKFDVQMLDFSAEGLPPKDRNGLADPFLKIDFDNFKLFKTDKESRTLSPSWGFQKRFVYRTKFVDKLSKKRMKIHCYDHDVVGQADFIGECSIDLHTLATGPRFYKITLMDGTRSAGTLRFTLVMKMLSNVSISILSPSLTMRGCRVPCSLVVFPSSANSHQEQFEVSQNSQWKGQEKTLQLETTLWDLLSPEDSEHLRFQILDADQKLLGEAVVSFAEYFNITPGKTVPFTVAIREKQDVVGELTAEIDYAHLPTYAQMSGGEFRDGQIVGGFLLLPGLPYPTQLKQSPPSLSAQPQSLQGPSGGMPAIAPQSDAPVSGKPQTETINIPAATLTEAIHNNLSPMQPMLGSDLQAQLKKWDYMDQVEMPPNWQMRINRTDGRPFFADHRTRMTCWSDPRFLPENWDQRIDPSSKKVYFAYHKTRQTTFTDPRGLSPGWEQRLTPEGQLYFAYHPAKKTTFTDPRGLPPRFTAALDEQQGRMYFKNHETRSTQWNDPRDGASAGQLTMWKEKERSEWWAEKKRQALDDLRRETEEALQRENFDMLSL